MIADDYKRDALEGLLHDITNLEKVILMLGVGKKNKTRSMIVDYHTVPWSVQKADGSVDEGIRIVILFADSSVLVLNGFGNQKHVVHLNVNDCKQKSREEIKKQLIEMSDGDNKQIAAIEKMYNTEVVVGEVSEDEKEREADMGSSDEGTGVASAMDRAAEGGSEEEADEKWRESNSRILREDEIRTAGVDEKVYDDENGLDARNEDSTSYDAGE